MIRVIDYDSNDTLKVAKQIINSIENNCLDNYDKHEIGEINFSIIKYALRE